VLGVTADLNTEDTDYPGSEMSHGQMLALAHEYRRIALSLEKLAIRNRPIALAPYRFAAIHAIELYLNAFLLFKGHSPKSLRGISHDLKQRQEMAEALGLVLRSNTIDGIRQIMLNREYLAVRYSVSHMKQVLEFYQLERILAELAKKVTSRICNGK